MKQQLQRLLYGYKYNPNKIYGFGWGNYWINPMLIEDLFERQKDFRFEKFIKEFKKLAKNRDEYSIPMIKINKLLEKYS